MPANYLPPPDPNREAVEVLEYLFCACLNEMTASGSPHEWSANSGLGRAERFLKSRGRVLSKTVPHSFRNDVDL